MNRMEKKVLKKPTVLKLLKLLVDLIALSS